MYINKVSNNTSNNKLNFTSRNNPVKSFNIASKLGDIKISELDYDREVNLTLIEKLSRFFTENFSKNTYYEPLIKIRCGTPAEKLKYQKEFDEYYSDIFNHKDNRDNLTMLVGKDKDGRILAGCLSYGYHYLPKGKDTTLYIDSVAVSPELRGLQIAKTMLEKTFEANQKSFNDVFLASTPMATTFYEKLGFKHMTRENPSQKVVLEKLDEITDYMDCLTPFSKPLQSDKPRWYDVCADAIKNEK